MSRGVDHESSPEELRTVNYRNRQTTDRVLFVLDIKQLWKSLKSSEEARVVVGVELPFAVGPQVELVFLMGENKGN